MSISLRYYYDQKRQAETERRETLAILTRLAERPSGPQVLFQEQDAAFTSEAGRQEFFEQLRDFSARHHVKLGRVFGSNRHRFWYLPTEFLLVYEERDLREVFPCEIDGQVVEVAEFLRLFENGHAWTAWSAGRRKDGWRHRELMERITADPGALEPGLRLVGGDVHVSRGFGEVGYIDLLFVRADRSYLLVEVKTRPEELDKAVGQIMRHRELFAAQNLIDKVRVGMAIACPSVPAPTRTICESVGIQWFELSKHDSSGRRGDS